MNVYCLFIVNRHHYIILLLYCRRYKGGGWAAKPEAWLAKGGKPESRSRPGLAGEPMGGKSKGNILWPPLNSAGSPSVAAPGIVTRKAKFQIKKYIIDFS